MDFIISKHIIIFFYIISFLSGMITITLSYFVYLKNKTDLFKHIKNFFLIFFLSAVCHFLYFYNEYYLFNDVLKVIFEVLYASSLIIFSYFWIILLHEMSGIKMKLQWNITFIVFLFYLFIIFMINVIFYPEEELDNPFLLASFFSFVAFYLGYFIYNVIILFGKVKKVTNTGIKIYLLCMIILMLTYLVFSFFGIIETLFPSLILIYFLYNILTCFFYYHNYLKQYEPIVTETIPESLDDIAKQYGLTEKEKETLVYVYKGYTNREIAEFLKISTNTVKTHNYHIFKKIGVSSRVELIHLIKTE